MKHGPVNNKNKCCVRSQDFFTKHLSWNVILLHFFHFPFIFPFISLGLYLFVCLFVCLFIYLLIYSFIYCFIIYSFYCCCFVSLPFFYYHYHYYYPQFAWDSWSNLWEYSWNHSHDRRRHVHLRISGKSILQVPDTGTSQYWWILEHFWCTGIAWKCDIYVLKNVLVLFRSLQYWNAKMV